MHRTDGAGRTAPGERGWAEIVVLVGFTCVIGFAFLWALVLHEKPPDDPDRADSVTATTDPLVPPTLPPPRNYAVSGTVNVRQGPATNTTVLGKLDAGTKALVECRTEGQNITNSEGSTNLWLRVNLGVGVGYVSALYIDAGDDIEDGGRIAVCL